ncbi:hypothetical protein NQ314_000698 [Rhamnusium bicolor]|uniref:Uncharacterized protein n=1 Tax=Rhamnusium bicolor TaxID=1586634 RepID=A0AAV8ZXB9_9CUCU|nr:hypothetical protein NQ314_000698 [Rhamnusium bicolor]
MVNMVYCTAKCQKWTTFSLAGVFVVLGMILALFWNQLFHKILTHELSLADTRTKGYSLWKETPIPMYLQFYFFNWTNSQDVNNASIKPVFEELGPYTYYEHHIRENITFNNNNTVTFLNKRLWRFMPEKSVGYLSDNVTTLNPIVATIGNLVKDKHYLVRKGVDFFLREKHVKLAISKTVDEFLFMGYDDPMLDLVHKLNITGFNVPYTKFGWFVERNGSAEYDGLFNMNTGADDVEKLGIVKKWNYNATVSFFEGNCGKVEGTTGELCSVELTKAGDDILYGIEGHIYKGMEKNFDNGTVYPDMKCFIPEGVVQFSGVRNVSLCKFGAPAFVSYPHFYLADPFYRNDIVGMKPNKENHEVFISLEPRTGIPLKVNAAFQINLKLEPVEGIKLLTDVKTILMPAFWFKQTAEMTKDLANQATLLLVMPSAGTYTGYGFIGIGTLLIIIGCFITYRKGWKKSEEEELLNQQSL